MLTKQQAAALRAHAIKRGTWSKEHKRIAGVLNRAMAAERELAAHGFLTQYEAGRVCDRLSDAALSVGFSITQRTDGKLFVFMPRRAKASEGKR